MLERVQCTPVGPAGLKPPHVLMTQALIGGGIIRGTIYVEAHVVSARNACWAGALAADADRVLWCDADVMAPPGELSGWIERQDAWFEEHPDHAAVGAAVRLRSGGLAFDFDEGREVPLYVGMGLVYWHVPRVVAALHRGGRPEEYPFQWLPPWTEDYDVARFLTANGARHSIDPNLTTAHLGVGEWRPAAGGDYARIP